MCASNDNIEDVANPSLLRYEMETSTESNSSPVMHAVFLKFVLICVPQGRKVAQDVFLCCGFRRQEHCVNFETLKRAPNTVNSLAAHIPLRLSDKLPSPELCAG